jgi:hypothetical protein
MAPGTLTDHVSDPVDELQPPFKRTKLSQPPEHVLLNDSEDADIATAVPAHPMDIKPAGNAYTASQNLKARCGTFARLPDELISHMFESFDADVLVRLGSTCKALYAFARLDELWRALFIR